MDASITGLVANLAQSALQPAIVKVADLDPLHLQDIPILRSLGALRLRQVERSVASLQDQLRKVAIAADPERQLAFGNLAIRFFEAAGKEHRDTKLAMLAAAAVQPVNAQNSDPFDLQLEIFFAIERLQPFHIALLAHVSQRHTRETETGHEHPLECTFAELMESRLALPRPRATWLTTALVTLREMGALKFEAGGLMPTDRGHSPMTEPYLIVQNCAFGLDAYGCKLVRYVQGAIEENLWDPEWPHPA
jgi:hypothetical protein